MNITALEICKSYVDGGHYVGDNCTGMSMYRVYGKEMNTLVSRNEIKVFYDYIVEHKSEYKKLTEHEREVLAIDFDNYNKQIGSCGTCFKCKNK